ncbi:hypothetical protein RJ45_07085 [Photobacterium gaetbulicola]|uniref:Uncharacterized protein n=1 Tax=Photobacterium gaetbulicola TaxID=1295392 RepID=A0A0B9H5X8_9GAMM|nr:hypothetical protein [Photobacterium gaetbulicola]KHT64292.1 hypothetical protein RJ45_07085 [Photobacterium gaetbulicola]
MDCVDFEGIKRDVSHKVVDIFESFEEHNNRLPTMEEFRLLFNNEAEQYIGPNEMLKMKPGSVLHDKLQEREQKLWRAVNELEAEQRFLRSETY